MCWTLAMGMGVWMAAAAPGGSPIGNPGYDATTAARLPIERVYLYRPEHDWTYSHHPHLTFYRGRFYALWSNGMRDEDAPGQRVLMATAERFDQWTEPVPLAEPGPGRYAAPVLTAAGFLAGDNRLTAWFGRYQYAGDDLEKGARRPGDQGHFDTGLWALTTIDGRTWSKPVDMGAPIVPNYGPRPTSTGRLIISGNVSFPWSDDPSGLGSWTMTGIYPPDMAGTVADDSEGFWKVKARMGWPVGLCEGSFYETDDAVLHMLLRSGTERLWVTESRDNGATWSPPVPTRFSDNGTKFQFGRLPDGRWYYVGCPDPVPAGRRCPLVLSLSRDGVAFDRHYILADEPYQQRAEGLYKGGEYGYPCALIHDGWIYVIVSRQKEAVEVLRAPLSAMN